MTEVYNSGGLEILDDGPIGSGTGNYNTFLSIQSNNSAEQGFNLDQNGQAVLDEGGGIHTHALQLSSVGDDGAGHYVFRLDINEPNSDTAGEVTLTDLIFYTGSAATAANWDTQSQSLTGLTQKAAFTPNVLLNDHSHGSGTDDYVILVDKSLFSGVDPSSYLTVYAKFTGNDGGFEEFRVKPATDDGGGGDSAPGIAIVKDTWALASDDTTLISVEGKTVLAGTNLTWTYDVTNTGDTAFATADVHVTDDQGVSVAYVSGDDGDNLLAPGETWHYEGHGTATGAAYENVGTATGDLHPTGSVTDSDPSSYTGIAPDIEIEKRTLDGTTSDDAVATDFAKATDGANILVGEAVTWIYEVTNGGDTPLSNVQLTDDKLGDLTGTLVKTGGNDDDLLEKGETWFYYKDGTAGTGTYSNIGTAKGDVTDYTGHSATDTATDGSSYTGIAPDIEIDKRTLAGTTSDQTIVADFLKATDGGAIATGQSVTWIYKVTNAGSEPLSNVQISDDKLGDIDQTGTLVKTGGNQDNFLDTGETWYYYKTGTATAGAYSNIGTAKGDVTDSAGHTGTDTDTDGSSYIGFTVGVHGLSQGFWGQHPEAWDGVIGTNKQGIIDTANLVASGVLKTYDILPASGGILLGDANGNGTTDIGEDTLLVSLAAAKQIILSSDSATDTRQILMKQALAAQLNIYNGDKDPLDLVGEAVKWLKGESPYASPNYTDGSSGKVDTDGNGVLSVGNNNTFEYNTTTKAFTFDANPSTSSTALTSNLNAWGKAVDVFDNPAVNPSPVVWADGQGLKNALEAYNLDKLIVSANGDLVGWSTDHGLTISNVYDNTVLDNFWLTLSHTSGFVLV